MQVIAATVLKYEDLHYIMPDCFQVLAAGVGSFTLAYYSSK